MNKFFGAGLQ